VQRENLLRRIDVQNIQRAFGLRAAEKHADDMLSIEAWLNSMELREQQEGIGSPFFCYNPLTSENGIFTLGKQGF